MTIEARRDRAGVPARLKQSGHVLARVRHGLVRAGAGAVVVSILGLVPTLLYGTSALRLPPADEWRSLVTARRVSEDLALAAGSAVFLVLWAWFALSAAAECWTVLRWRRRQSEAPLPAVPSGPTGWLRALVRLAVLAGAALGTASVGIDHSTADAFRSGQVVHAAATPSPVAGDWLRSSASLTRNWSDVLSQRPPAAAARDHDRDGRIDRPVADPPASSARSMGYPSTREIVSAVMFAAGALALLDSARRRRLRAAPLGARLDLPSLAQVRTEMMLRSLARDEQMVRLDVALRAVSRDLAARGALPLVAVVGSLGDVRILPSEASPAEPPWRSSSTGWWTLPPTVPLEELAERSRTDAPPCPALLHLGATDDGECFIDLEAVGILEIVSPHGKQIATSMGAALSMSPFLDDSRLITIDQGATEDELASDGRVASLDEALDLAAVRLGDTLKSIGAGSTFDRRVSTQGGESFSPVVIMAMDLNHAEIVDLRHLITPGRGIGALIASNIGGSPVPHHEPASSAKSNATSRRIMNEPWILRADPDGADPGGFDTGVVGLHVLEPCGIRLRPALVTRSALANVRAALAIETEHLAVAAPVVSIDVARPALRGVPTPFIEPDWSLLVRTLGAVEVVAADGTLVQFDRSKALELVVWLALHRRRPTRGAARAALWDLDVRDATFANVVSEARRALAKASMPAPGDEWIPRTLTDSLPLHEGVVSDADLLEARVRHAEGLAHREAIEVITPGLDVVTGMPFAGSNYLWADAEGHASAHVLLVVGAATRLAQHHLALGDVEGVFWATGKGLLVLSGHEELVAMRMRAHAGAGDLAGVRDEWERYERALQADPWAAAQPSPKLTALRRELLGRVS